MQIEFRKIYEWSGDYFVPFRKEGNYIRGIDLNFNKYEWEFTNSFVVGNWKLCDPEDVPEKILEIFNDPLFEIESLRKIPE